ncbi:hypothetical protein Plhal304r1_c036g0111111 [Plasmopara halstedii]
MLLLTRLWWSLKFLQSSTVARMEWGATLAVVALKSTVQLLQSKSERKSPDEIDATTMISPCYQQRIVIKSTYRWFQDEDGRQLPFSLLSDSMECRDAT